MITSLRLVDFKSFVDETLHLGPFTLIVGANASGKSNLRDAFRFLHGIGRGYTLAEIVGGKYGTDWKPIRGTAGGIARMGAAKPWEDLASFTIEVDMRLDLEFAHDPPLRPATYRIEARPEVLGGGKLSVMAESLWIDSEEIYSESVFEDAEKQLDRSQPALQQLLHWQFDFPTFAKTRTVTEQFYRTRFFDFLPEQLRAAGLPGQTALGDSGENLPTVLQKICEDSRRKALLIDWVRELTPMDVSDIALRPDLSGKTHLFICEGKRREVSAESASEGTLRFLAMLAALLSEEAGGLYFFEEIENGLHPSRLHLLLELIERQAAKGRAQVVATTHSPELLSMVSDETFENVAITCRLEDTNDAIIRRVADLPNVKKLRRSQGLGRLLAEGWVERALEFTAGTGGDYRG